jgi:succinoglycan biosynthesis transport protein ExoP
VRLGGILSEVPVEVESQIQLIQSEAVALAVVRKFNLADDPEFVGPPVGIRGWIHTLLSDILPRSGPSKAEHDSAWAAASGMLNRLKVTRTGYVFEIEFSSLNPKRAAQIANAFADAYVEEQGRRKHQAADEASAWLKGQIQELHDQSVRADEAVAQFKEKNNIVSVDGKLISDQQLTLLNSQLVLAREKTAEVRARLDRVEAVINANSPDRRAIATVTDSLSNPIIVKLRTQYLDLSSREVLWSREYGANHLAVVNVRRQMRDILSSIHEELLRMYRSEYELAKQRQAELEKAVVESKSQYQETSQALATLRGLESSAETYRGLYRTALQRGTELVQKQTYPGAEARMITRASTPAQPSGPTPLVILCASAFGGVLLGFGAGVLRAALDRVFRTPAQIEVALRAKCLSLVPAISAPSAKRARHRSSPPNAQPRTIRRSANIIWEVVDQPLSRFSEAMRSLKLEAHLNGTTALGFTSSLPKEGKSTIAAAFALLTAQAGSRAILIDCDLRNPALSAILAPNAQEGLLEVISGKRQLEDVLWNDAATGLAFLPAVMTKSRAPESSTILSSSSLRALFERLPQNYDSVIVDFSPTAPIIDVQSTAALVDSYVFVVEWGRTKIDVAELALSKASVVQKNLLGVVLNNVDFRVLGQYEGYRREYYSDKHYGQYGQV